MATPGVKSSFHDLEEDKPLEARLHTAFRGSAARANYLAADRLDAQFACKEVCRWMSSPSERAWQALKRICRFLQGLPRVVYTYPQQTVDDVDVYTDTDWAGCVKTRKSTSGGCLMLGSHAIKHWSSTQSSVALSSGEAEFAGVIRGAGQGLGYQALLRDFGVSTSLRVWTDSSAAIGICNRQGLGKLRHLDTHTLWIQQAVRLGRVDLRKVAGEVNPADLFTKHSLSRQRLEELVALHGCKYIGGRASTAPLAKTGASNKATMASESRVVGAVVGNNEDPSSTKPVGLGSDAVGCSGTLHGSGPQAQAEEALHGSGSPAMPHLDLSPSELDRLYPPIPAPVDEQLDDMVDDADDSTLQRGMAIASSIRTAMMREGRTRRRDQDDVVGMVLYPSALDATVRSPQPSSPGGQGVCGTAPPSWTDITRQTGMQRKSHGGDNITRRRDLDGVSSHGKPLACCRVGTVENGKPRPASLGVCTGAGVRQSPVTEQVSSTPMMQGRVRRALSPGGLPTCMAANSSVVLLLDGGVAEVVTIRGTKGRQKLDLARPAWCAFRITREAASS